MTPTGQEPRVVRLLTQFLGVILVLALTARSESYPELSVKDLSGQAQSLSAYKGKILVVNFWATWCGPCREELPMLSQLAGQYSAGDVFFVAISLDDATTQGKIPGFLEKKKITLPVWTGATPDTLKQLDLGKIVPATIILDRDGTAVGRIMGEAQRKDITSRVDWLLNGRVGEAPQAVVKHF
ncbi:MAG: TlpA family protein disulfide reductase [Candidatus Acidiferrales bacterium]